MASTKVLTEAANPVFCQRVAFMAIRAAQQVASESPDTPDHAARAAYAHFIFRGDERALLLTLHVLAANDSITAALENGTSDDVQDADIESALGAIWNARASAYTAVNGEFNQVRALVDQATKAVAAAQQQPQEQ